MIYNKLGINEINIKFSYSNVVGNLTSVLLSGDEVLEDVNFFRQEAFKANPYLIKQMTDRKSDSKDAVWIAKLQHIAPKQDCIEKQDQTTAKGRVFLWQNPLPWNVGTPFANRPITTPPSEASAHIQEFLSTNGKVRRGKTHPKSTVGTMGLFLCSIYRGKIRKKLCHTETTKRSTGKNASAPFCGRNGLRSP